MCCEYLRLSHVGSRIRHWLEVLVLRLVKTRIFFVNRQLFNVNARCNHCMKNLDVTEVVEIFNNFLSHLGVTASVTEKTTCESTKSARTVSYFTANRPRMWRW